MCVGIFIFSHFRIKIRRHRGCLRDVLLRPFRSPLFPILNSSFLVNLVHSSRHTSAIVQRFQHVDANVVFKIEFIHYIFWGYY